MVASKCTVSFRKPMPRKYRREEASARPTVSRAATLLALAYEIDDAIRRGEIKDMAEAARLANVTRARMTQIVNLLLLPPEVQAEVLDPASTRRERELRHVASVLWLRQNAR